jgi:CheY-like chemotaxis protein
MNNKIICVIDDDDIIQYIVKTIIEGFNDGSTILQYKNGEIALQSLNELSDGNGPDIILLDINMPVMGGWQFLDEFIKIKTKFNKKIEIFILSSSNAPEDKIRAKVYNDIVGYINKPIGEETLKKVVHTENEE